MPAKRLGDLKATSDGHVGLLRHRMREFVHPHKQLRLQHWHRERDLGLDKIQHRLCREVQAVAHASDGVWGRRPDDEAHAKDERCRLGRGLLPHLLKTGVERSPLDDGEPSVDAAEVGSNYVLDALPVAHDVREAPAGKGVDVFTRVHGGKKRRVQNAPAKRAWLGAHELLHHWCISACWGDNLAHECLKSDGPGTAGAAREPDVIFMLTRLERAIES